MVQFDQSKDISFKFMIFQNGVSEISMLARERLIASQRRDVGDFAECACTNTALIVGPSLRAFASSRRKRCVAASDASFKISCFLPPISMLFATNMLEMRCRSS